MVNAVILLSFFPFIRYIPIGESESQPIAAIVAGISCLIVGVSPSRAARSLLALVALIVTFAALAYLGMRIPLGTVSQQAVAYVAPLVVALFLWNRTNLISWPLILGCAIAYIAVGFLQITGLLPGFIDAILKELIPRYQPGLAGGGRGVVMLAPEPDYASRQIILFAALAIYMRIAGRISARTVAFSLAVSIASMILINRSITGIGLLFIFLGTFVLFLARTKYIIFPIVILALIFPAAINFLTKNDFSDVTKESPRIVQMGTSFLQAFSRGTFGFNDLVMFASARLVTNAAALRAIPEVSLVGVGIGQAEAAVVEAIQNDTLFSRTPFPQGNLKPQSYFLSLGLETGLVGCVLIVMSLGSLFLSVLSRNNSRTINAFRLACIIVAMTQLTFLGPHSLPTPWILLALTDVKRKSP